MVSEEDIYSETIYKEALESLERQVQQNKELRVLFPVVLAAKEAAAMLERINSMETQIQVEFGG